MKAAVFDGTQSLTLKSVPVPEPEPEYVLIKVKASGICGSDLHTYFGHWGRPQNAAGHEFAGDIVATGSSVEQFKAGDRVVVECFSHCGKCSWCRQGLYNQCINRSFIAEKHHAGFAEYACVHQSAVYLLPDDLSYPLGALVEPLAVSYHAYRQAEHKFPATTVVIGGGTIGLLAAAVAQAAGDRTFVLTKYDQQLTTAVDFGSNPIDIRQDDYLDRLHREIYPGADTVVENTASTGGLKDALKLIRPGGWLVLVGGYSEATPIELGTVVGKEVRIAGSNCYCQTGSKADFNYAIDFMVERRETLSGVITHTFPLSEISRAFTVAADKNSGSIKVQLHMG